MTNRRDFIKKAGLGMAATAAVGTSNLVLAKPNEKKKKALRVVHMTDIHVQPGLTPETGMAKALHAVQNLNPQPDIILNGGDSIMDALGRDKNEVQAQWKVWNAILKNENSIEIAHCIGNHDVWGWSKITGKKKRDKLYGKQWATEEFGIKNRYYSFDKANWHFIVLDSTHSKKIPGYTAKLDEEQFAWLQEDLKNTPADKPICVLSHIPIISFTPFFDGDNEKSGNWKVPGAWMHIDARRIKDLFYQHKNVKVALSGHIHLCDEVEYLGVKYYCNGAVSGAWWGGTLQEFPPAFAVLDLYEDGTCDHQLVPYEWK